MDFSYLFLLILNDFTYYKIFIIIKIILFILFILNYYYFIFPIDNTGSSWVPILWETQNNTGLINVRSEKSGPKCPSLYFSHHVSSFPSFELTSELSF